MHKIFDVAFNYLAAARFAIFFEFINIFDQFVLDFFNGRNKIFCLNIPIEIIVKIIKFLADFLFINLRKLVLDVIFNVGSNMLEVLDVIIARLIIFCLINEADFVIFNLVINFLIQVGIINEVFSIG